MAKLKSLEELTFSDEKIVDSSGTEVTATPIGIPLILEVNYRASRAGQTDDVVEVILNNVPPGANAYTKGEIVGAPLVRAPYWDYLPVQFYRI